MREAHSWLGCWTCVYFIFDELVGGGVAGGDGIGWHWRGAARWAGRSTGEAHVTTVQKEEVTNWENRKEEEK